MRWACHTCHARGEACGVRVAAVGNHLDPGCVAACDALREIARENDDAVQAPGRQLIDEGAPIRSARDGEELGSGERADKGIRHGRRLFDHDAEPQPGRIE